MRAIIDHFLNHWISKKLFAFIVVTSVTVVGAVFSYEIPENFYWFSAAYVGGQSFVDGFIKVKGA